MDYIAYLKRYDNYDKFVLFLLALGMNISQTAEAAEVTRETVYQVIKRNQKIVDDYAIAVGGVIKEAESEHDTGSSATLEGPDGATSGVETSKR